MTQFDLPRDLPALAARLPAFLEMAGETAWWKRVDQLDRDARKSEFQTKIVLDHHWLEMELTAQLSILKAHGRLLSEEILPRSMAALLFAGIVAELSAHLTPTGRVRLAGRLRDALKSTFSGLYLELDLALSLLHEGFDVTFPDLEGEAAWDLSFKRDMTAGELECKSLSADAGRKIHRKDFYRFVDALGPEILKRVKAGSREVLVVTLDERLLPDTASQRSLRSSVAQVLGEQATTTLSGPGFQIDREDLNELHGGKPFTDMHDLYGRCQDRYGGNCQVAGPLSENGGCLIVVRSKREDDPSRAQLDALKKASSQLSGTVPGFIAVQHEEVSPQDLAKRPLRRNAAILAMALFHTEAGKKISAIHHSAYDGFHSAHGIIARPAFVCWNPNFTGWTEGLPFASSIPNSEFARLLDQDPADAEPDDGGRVKYW